MTKFGTLADELESDFPAVDVTTVVFSSDFAGVGCCVIPQEKVLEIIAALRAAARPAQEPVAWQYAHKGANHWYMLRDGKDPTEWLKQWPDIEYDVRPLYAQTGDAGTGESNG